MRITINSVNIETVNKGKTKYDKAVVAYSYNGEPRTQNIMSFANPSVFKKVQELKEGQEIDVTITKNAQGYNEWASINDVGGASPSPAPATTRVSGSNYETPEERARKQVYIIKQSSISNAIEYFKQPGAKDISISDVIEVAQQFADWVLADTQE